LIKSANMFIWGREFTIPVDYNCYPGETLLSEQIDAIKTFLGKPEWLEQAKILVEQFCKEQLMEDCENTKKDNIFSYIKPQGVFVKREKNPRIALMCKYRYDIEHGLAIVFSSTGKITVGPQDIIL